KLASRASLSVVIPVLNAERDLPGCLESIVKQQVHSVDYEIVVADGGSTDSTRRIAADGGARIVDNPYRLAEPGVAVGIKAACGRSGLHGPGWTRLRRATQSSRRCSRNCPARRARRQASSG